MASTKIEYLDETWNVAPGCTMVSPGCVNCWAQMMAKRLALMGKENYSGLTDEHGRWTGAVHMLPERLDAPLQINTPKRIGVNYMGDLFHPNVTFDFIDQVFAAMYKADWHTYFILTKRPETAYEYLRGCRLDAKPYQHVLIGSTVENQEWAVKRVKAMTDIAEAGFRTWISYEPAVGPVYWGPYNFIDFMAAGGESGSKARIPSPDWFRSTRDWCGKHGIKFFFKQWGSWAPMDELPAGDWSSHPSITRNGENPVKMVKVGKHKAGRTLDGQTWEQMP